MIDRLDLLSTHGSKLSGKGVKKAIKMVRALGAKITAATDHRIFVELAGAADLIRIPDTSRWTMVAFAIAHRRVCVRRSGFAMSGAGQTEAPASPYFLEDKA